MADAPIVHIGENSPEQVAYKLYQDIRAVTSKVPDQKWILDTYAECLNVVQLPGHRVAKATRPG